MTVIKNVEKYFDIGPELLHTIVTIIQLEGEYSTSFVLQRFCLWP